MSKEKLVMSKQAKTTAENNDFPGDQPNAVTVQPSAVPTTVDNSMYESDAGAGNENVTAQNMAIPIISILQANSPQCKKSDPKYVVGASEGDFYNNVTNVVMKGDLKVISCFFEKVFIEWMPNRGGLVKIHDANTPLKDQITMIANSDGKMIPTLASGNVLAETDQNYVLIIKEDGTYEPAVISMASSALKPSRIWNTLINGQQLMKSDGRTPFKPARYAFFYKLFTKGLVKGTNSWSTWAVESAGQVTDPNLYNAAKGLYNAVKGGLVKVKQEEVDTHAPAAKDDAEIPFE
jgi:hypothetical protein